MPSLREEQQALQAAILESLGPGPRRGGLAVYRNAYAGRLAGALRTNYPVLSQVLGAEAFDLMARKYAAERPSQRFSIRWHGDALGQWLADGALADLARMEWALGNAFDAADARPADSEYLTRFLAEEWPALRFALHPSVSVLPMTWNVGGQWQAMRAEGRAPPPERKDHDLLVWRKSLQAHWRSASKPEGAALRALGLHATLQAACEAAASEDAEEVGAWFVSWICEGMLVAREGPCP